MSVSQRYQKLTQLEHLHARPEMYLGGMELEKIQMWLHDKGLTEVEVSRGLLKVFEEITSNAFDNVSRGGTTKIQVEVTPEEFSVKNNGAAIPIEVHEEHGITIPELVFGHFLTGDNYNDDDTRERGGRNGYGAKLTNAFSTRFYVEVVDTNVKKKLRLTFSNNMRTVQKKITACSLATSYTKVAARIDFPKFGLSAATPLLLQAWERRVWDLAATTPPHVGVYLNKTKLPIKSYKDYCQKWGACLYFKVSDTVELAIYQDVHDVPPPSFVNGVECNRGTHIQHWALPLSKKLAEVVSKTLRVQVTPAKMNKHIQICGNFCITNPKFASQTKDVCTTHKRNYSKWNWPPAALKKSTAYLKEIALRAAEKEVRKKMKTKVTRHISVPKLDDARYAGHPTKWKNCSLILTEGDSAKGFAVSGFNVVGRDYYGAFPLRGKFLNVKSAALGKTMKNKEVQNVLKIFGLEIDKKPTQLRYGKCIVMADQDHDGSHIIGLLLNLFSHYAPWKTLLDDGFLQIFVTPIIKAKKGRQVHKFFSLDEYHAWKQEEDRKNWTIKYYKGLGTSTASEAQECFRDLNRHLIPILPGEQSAEYMDLAFNKDRAADRKHFLTRVPEHIPNPENFKDFVCGRLFEFYHANNYRTIPNLMDGLKPTKRKILYALLKLKTNEERKVAALAAYVTEKMGYHHGEASLAKTIIGMAQNFVGSNNINFLVPEGQFGTRGMGGKDAASPRYIFTKLAPIARKIFSAIDFDQFVDLNAEPILPELEEEGQSVEPQYLAPILPLIFINGEQGIGVGWACDFPSYDPKDISNVVRGWLCSKDRDSYEFNMPEPKWRGFTGAVLQEANKVKTCGRIIGVSYRGKLKDNEFLVTELPIRMWTMDFRTWIENQSFVKRVIEESKLDTVQIRIITADPMTLEKIRDLCGSKLQQSMNRLLVCYNARGELHCYSNESEMMKEWCEHRRDLYIRRQKLMLMRLHHEVKLLHRKMCFFEIVAKHGSNDETLIRHQMAVMGHGEIDDLLDLSIRQLMKGAKPWRAKIAEKNTQIETLESKQWWTLWLEDLDALGYCRKRQFDER